MMLVSIIFEQIREWVSNNPAKVVGGVSIILIGGYMTYKVSEYKAGVVVHDQGYKLEEQSDGLYRLNVDGRLSSRRFDLDNEPRDFAVWVAEIGVQRFGKKWGCSYPIVIVGDSIYKFQFYDRITAHASGFNSVSVATMLTRTDNEELNHRTVRSFESIVLPDITDTLNERYDGVQFVLFHSDVATNGKEDPHEFRPMLTAKGLRWDDRMILARIDDAPTYSEAQRMK